MPIPELFVLPEKQYINYMKGDFMIIITGYINNFGRYVYVSIENGVCANYTYY